MDPRLPDAIYNPRRLRFYRLPSLLDDPKEYNPRPIRYYVPTIDEEAYPNATDMKPIPNPAVIEPLVPIGPEVDDRPPAYGPLNDPDAAPIGTDPVAPPAPPN